MRFFCLFACVFFVFFFLLGFSFETWWYFLRDTPSAKKSFAQMVVGHDFELLPNILDHLRNKSKDEVIKHVNNWFL